MFEFQWISNLSILRLWLITCSHQVWILRAGNWWCCKVNVTQIPRTPSQGGTTKTYLASLMWLQICLLSTSGSEMASIMMHCANDTDFLAASSSAVTTLQDLVATSSSCPIEVSKWRVPKIHAFSSFLWKDPYSWNIPTSFCIEKRQFGKQVSGAHRSRHRLVQRARTAPIRCCRIPPLHWYQPRPNGSARCLDTVRLHPCLC